MEVLELKNITAELRNSWGAYSRSELAEERTSKLDDKWIEIMQSEEQRKNNDEEKTNTASEKCDTSLSLATYM